MTSVTAEITSYVGNWKVLEVYETVISDTPRTLPANGPFVFRFTINEQSPEDTLNVGLKVGNTMRTSVKILDEPNDNEASIQVGLMMSTQMMPPQDQFQFEMFLSRALPKMTTMKLNSDQTEMLLEGDAKFVLQATDTSDL
jgi:hypothetical protein